MAAIAGIHVHHSKVAKGSQSSELERLPNIVSMFEKVLPNIVSGNPSNYCFNV